MSIFRRRLLSQDNTPLTVEKCVDRQLFSKSVDGWNLVTITQNKRMPVKFSRIIDFVDYFFNWHTSSEDSKRMFAYNGNTGYLSDENITELLEIIKDNKYYQWSEFFFKLHNVSAADKDLVINFHSYSDGVNPHSYNNLRDKFTNSTFNTITLNVENCVFSVIQNMFKSCKAKKITFNLLENGHVKPTDMSGFNEFNGICTSVPNKIDYQNCTNVGYAWERCFSLPEIPSYYTVTDEESRLNTPENVIGGSAKYGITFADQAFNVCRVLTKIGPVLDFRGVIPNNDIYHQPSALFNDSTNISDIRIKNLCNGDWSFIYYNWRGLPNINQDSVKFIIENLGRQVDISFTGQTAKQISEPTYNWYNIITNSSKSLMFNMFRIDGSTRSRFLNITDAYQVQIPAGLTMRLVWWIGNGENEYNCAHNEFTDIIGDGELHTYNNTLADSGYNYCTVELFKTDGSDLTKDILHKILMESPEQFAFYVGSSTTTNYFPSAKHNLYFHYSDTNISSLTKDIIQAANDKGWTVNFGNVVNNTIEATEITPDFFN